MTKERIEELQEKMQEFILNESVFADDHPSWGEVAEAQTIAESKWDETDEGKELKALLSKNVICPECGGTNTRVVENDGGYECLDCQTPEHESWFGIADDDYGYADQKNFD